jgi:hypothetical protein
VSGDIVDELRETSGADCDVWSCVMLNRPHVHERAANEIERLRSALWSAKSVPHGCSTGFVPCWCES